MSGTFYLAGPMTGIPQFNYPAFHAAAAELRAYGYTIISPAEEDTHEYQRIAMASSDGLPDADGTTAGQSWGDLLSRCVKVIADGVDGVVVMRDWEKSRGARLECFTALLCKKRFLYHLPGQRPLGVVPRHILNKLHDYTKDTL